MQVHFGAHYGAQENYHVPQEEHGCYQVNGGSHLSTPRRDSEHVMKTCRGHSGVAAR